MTGVLNALLGSNGAAAAAGITRIASTIIVGGASGATSASIDTTGATLLVASTSRLGNTVTVSDSKSNTWTALTTYTGTSQGAVQFFYCLSPAVGSGHTVTVAGGSTFSSVCMIAYSGASAFDKATGANSSLSPGTLAPAGNNELILSACSADSTSDPTACSGFTVLRHQAGDNATVLGHGVAEVIQTSSSSVSPTWTLTNGSSNFATALVAFS